MEIIISSNTSKPIYEQITSQIKAMIMSGKLQTGDPIPSMRSLAKSIHVSVLLRIDRNVPKWDNNINGNGNKWYVRESTLLRICQYAEVHFRGHTMPTLS